VVDCYRDAGVVVPELIVDPGFNEMDNEAQINLLAPRLAQRDEHIKQLIASCQQSKKDFQKLLKIVFKQWQAGSLGDSRLQSWQQFKDGALAALETVRQQCGSGSTSAVFTSGGVIATLVAHVLRMPDSAVYSVFEPLINCSITRLLYGPERISLSSYNEYSYLQCSAGEAAVSSIISYR
jgi:broad specificity phosphatase PhoE